MHYELFLKEEKFNEFPQLKHSFSVQVYIYFLEHTFYRACENRIYNIEQSCKEISFHICQEGNISVNIINCPIGINLIDRPAVALSTIIKQSGNVMFS